MHEARQGNARTQVGTAAVALVFFLALSAQSGADARTIGPDTFGYRATDTVPFAFEDIAATGTRTLAGLNDSAFEAPMGFTFSLYGRSFGVVSWSTNGLVTFGGVNAQALNLNLATQPMAATVNRPVIAVLWDDWRFTAGVSDAVYYETRGSPGQRRFIIQWNRAVGLNPADNITYQVLLFEGTNTIIMQYLDVDSGDAAAFGALATVAIRDRDGQTNGRNLQWSFNTAAVANGMALRFSSEPDLAAPLVTVNTPGNGAIFAASSVLVTATVLDENETTVSSTPAGVSGSLPVGGGVVSGSVPLTEGSNDIVVSAVDAMGNIGGTSVTVLRDTTPPELEISPASGMVFGDSPASFTFGVLDATATTVVFGTHAFGMPAGGGSGSGLVGLTVGLNSVVFTATDGVGNTTTVQVDVIFDPNAPVVSIDSPEAGTFFGPGGSPAAVMATVDDLSDCTVSSVPAGVSGSVPAGGGVVAGAVALVEGPNEITVSATDRTGRTSAATVMVFLDTIRPLVEIVSPAPGAVRGVIDWSASATDTGSGVSRVEFLVDGGLLNSFSAPPFEAALDTAGFGDGLHVLMARAFDMSGNSASAMVTILVDHAPPAVSFDAPAGGATVRGMVSFETLASDGGSGLSFLEVQVNGGPASSSPAVSYDPPVSSDVMSGEEDTTRWPDGPLNFTATAVDAAGNQTVVMLTVMVDNTVEETLVLSPAQGSTVSGVVPITVEFSGAAIDTMEVFVDEVRRGTSSQSPFTVLFDTRLRLDGEMVIAATVTDVHGNFTTASARVTVDNMSFCFSPSVIYLDAKLPGLVTAHVKGPNISLLLPLRKREVELHVPGASPVPALVAVRVQTRRGELKKLMIRFDRRKFLAAIRAGMAAGEIRKGEEVPVTLVAEGQVVGVDLVEIRAPERHHKDCWKWWRKGRHGHRRGR